MNDGALDPVVEAPQALDPAVRLSPVPTTLWDGIVMLPNNVMHAPGSGSLLGLLEQFLFALLLTLAESFLLGVADPGGASWPFSLSGW